MDGWIVFEGYDGAGKSSLIQGVIQLLAARGYEVLPVRGFPNKWTTADVMSQVAMGTLPESIAGELRFQRFMLEYLSTIVPALAAGVNVLADRGALSALWRLKSQERLDLAPRLDDIIQQPALTVFIRTEGEICWERICADRSANRVETGIRRCLPDRRRDAFLAAHADYFDFCERNLRGLPHIVLDGHQDRESLIWQAAAAIEPHLVKRHPNCVADDAVEACLWLGSLRRNSVLADDEAVIEALSSQHTRVRAEALAAARRLRLAVAEPALRRLVQDRDRLVRRNAGALIATQRPSLICSIADDLCERPGQALLDFVEMQQASGLPEPLEIASRLAGRFPFLLRAIAHGAKQQKSMPIGMMAAILTCDDARPIFLKNLADQTLALPNFQELEAACGVAAGDAAFGSRVALQAKAAEQDSAGLLERRELLFSEHTEVVQAAVDAYLATGLQESIPMDFAQHADVSIRIRLASANAHDLVAR